MGTTEQESRQIAEQARETEWAGRTFLRELFLGKLSLPLIHPFPMDATVDRPEFTRFYAAMETVLRLGSKLGSAYGVGIGIEAPIIQLSKAEIVAHAAALGAPLHLTWSCYEGGDAPCGACDSCLLRAAGFAAAGIPDPALPG